MDIQKAQLEARRVSFQEAARFSASTLPVYLSEMRKATSRLIAMLFSSGDAARKFRTTERRL
jgi:hypothetical protein